LRLRRGTRAIKSLWFHHLGRIELDYVGNNDLGIAARIVYGGSPLN